MASGGPQRPYWPDPPDWPDGKLCQVTNDDVSAGRDPVGNVRGGGWMEKYRETIYLTGKDEMLSAVLGLRGGVDDGVNNGPLQDPAWHI